MSDADPRWARAYLSRVGEPADLGLWSLVEQLGPVDAARLVERGEAQLGPDSAAAARRGRISPRDDLDSAQRHGIRLLTPEDAAWPHFALAAMCRAASAAVAAGIADEPAPPLALWVKGDVDTATLGIRSVALVGARAATDYGLGVAADIAYDVARRGVAVVSGGAFGIDAAAHRAALAAAGETILVSAGGLDRPYPSAHGALYGQVAERGLLISESPPGAAPFRRRFLSRNRLIAAFGGGVVIIEAGRRSGSLNTAAHARRYGRPLMAVPGPVTSAMSVGCHDLLRRDPADGSVAVRLVTSAADVMAEIEAAGAGPDGGGDAERAAGPGESRPAPRMAARRAREDGHWLRDELDALSPAEGAVYDALRPRAWTTEDELSIRSGVPAPALRAALAVLVVAGLAQAGDEGVRLGERAAEATRRRAAPDPGRSQPARRASGSGGAGRGG